jgi:hypothetical protein
MLRPPGTKEARTGSHRDGAATHLTLSTYILTPCFAAGLFLSRVCALLRVASGVCRRCVAIRPAVAGTRGVNPSWGGKDRAPARDRQGEAYA